MKGRQRVAALWAVCAVFSTPSRAQAPAATPPPATTSPAPAAAPRPSADGLGALSALAGTWDVDATLFVKGQPPVKLSGTTENTWVLGGHFLQSTFNASGGGTTVDGLTTYGYDRDRHEYFAVSVNTSAFPYGAMHGPYYDGSRSFVLRSETSSTGGVRVRRRQVIRLEGDNRHVVEVFIEVAGAPPAKLIEAVSTRR